MLFAEKGNNLDVNIKEMQTSVMCEKAGADMFTYPLLILYNRFCIITRLTVRQQSYPILFNTCHIQFSILPYQFP